MVFNVKFLRMCYGTHIFPVMSFYKMKYFGLFPWKKKNQRKTRDTLSPAKLGETENNLWTSTSNRWQNQCSPSMFRFSLFLIFCDISFSLPLGENPSVASSVYARTRDFIGWSWPGWKYCCSHSCSTWLPRLHTGIRTLFISNLNVNNH